LAPDGKEGLRIALANLHPDSGREHDLMEELDELFPGESGKETTSL
jgi:hypothetical protein